MHLLEGHSLDVLTHDDHTPSGEPEGEGHTHSCRSPSLDEREMSMAETFVSLYSDSDVEDLTDITQLTISDYTFTPSPPNRLHQSHTHQDHTHSSPSPRQKLVYSPPKSVESADLCHRGNDSVLYTTAVDESFVREKSAGVVGGVKGGVSDEGSPLDGTYLVDSTSSHKTNSTCYTPSPLECSFVADIKVQIPTTLGDLSDSQLRERLVALGERPGPITPSTKVAYLAYLAKLEAGVQPAGNKGYKGEGVC